eukprot:1852642-Karenia_brevis.AAC.1
MQISTRFRSKPSKRKALAAQISRILDPEYGGLLPVRRRPLGTLWAMDLDAMGKALTKGAPVPDIAASWTPEPLKQDEMLEAMLLVLWDTMILTASERWTKRGVANLSHERTHLLAHCFLRGQAVGAQPLHD